MGRGDRRGQYLQLQNVSLPDSDRREPLHSLLDIWRQYRDRVRIEDNPLCRILLQQILDIPCAALFWSEPYLVGPNHPLQTLQNMTNCVECGCLRDYPQPTPKPEERISRLATQIRAGVPIRGHNPSIKWPLTKAIPRSRPTTESLTPWLDIHSVRSSATNFEFNSAPSESHWCWHNNPLKRPSSGEVTKRRSLALNGNWLKL